MTLVNAVKINQIYDRKRGKGRMNFKRTSILVSYVGVFSALSAGMRLAKHAALGSFQFINIPLLFSMLTGALLGFEAGFGVGLISFLVSDSILGLGPWTLVDGIVCGLIGGLWAKVGDVDSVINFVLGYLSALAYDLITSWILYMIVGFEPLEAFLIGFVGLFLPVAGGNAILIGPLTEVSTALALAIVLPKMRNWFYSFGYIA